MEEIVEKLKARRLELGLSIAEVANRMGTERARLSEIENGRVGLTLKRLYNWADALGWKARVEFE